MPILTSVTLPAARDAMALWALIADTIPGATSALLTDGTATLANIRGLLTNTLDAAGPDDVVLLSFAGHGTHDHRLVAADSSAADLVATTLPMVELARQFKASRAKAIICFLDCCFSGGAPGRVIEDSPIARDPTQPFVDIAGNGRVLFAACDVDESALEDPATRHGLFTQALLHFLQIGDGQVSVLGLADEVQRRVRAEASRLGYVQTPVVFGHVTGEVTIPVLKPGANYASAFPTRTLNPVSAKFSDLLPYGIPPTVIDAWTAQFPSGLNSLQQDAINQHGLLNGNSMLVVAPTTAGKTFIGELAAMKAVEQGKKVVFLLPYRALVNEKYEDFSQLYGDRIGLRVARCSGDWQDQVPAILRGKYDIAFFTYETFLSMALNARHVLHQIGLVALDEAQFLSDPHRGITVELLLTLLVSIRASGLNPQLVCLSAVIGGTNALDQWLGCQLLTTTVRPVPLIEGVLNRQGQYQAVLPDGTVQTSQFIPAHSVQVRRKEPSSQDVVVPLTRQLVGAGEKVLIFRNTRGTAQGCANYLAEELGLSPASDVIDALPELDQTTRSVELRHCLEGGVAFHSTDLRKEERRLVENAFRDPNGLIKVLVATSTVAAGINTPASSVIIVESEFLGGGQPTPYTVAGYKNMAGRAGRLGFSQEGKSILLADTRMDQDRLFRKYVQGTPERMVSSFDARHPETWLMRLLAQVKSVPRSEAFALLANTYGGYLAARADANWRARFEPEVQALIDRMLQNGLVESAGADIKLTMLGMACGQSPLQLNSALQLVEMIRALPVASVSPLTLMVICEALPEMDADYTPLQRGRRGEPARQAELAGRYGHQIAGLLQRRAGDDLTYHRRCKRALVLGDWLDGLSMDDIEKAYTPNPFSRMAHGDIIGYADQARFFLQSALRIASIIWAGAAFSDADAERLLNRLEIGIPEAALPLLDLPMALTRGEYLALSNAGVSSVDAVKTLPLARLEELLGKRRATNVRQGLDDE
jgi:helicase